MKGIHSTANHAKYAKCQERVARLADSLLEISLRAGRRSSFRLGGEFHPGDPHGLVHRLAHVVNRQCRDGHRGQRLHLDAGLRGDFSRGSIIGEDDSIDAFYEQVYFEAMDQVVGDPANLERINYLLWAAHNLERIADRTTNVCERTVFVVTGRTSDLSMDEVEGFSAEVR